MKASILQLLFVAVLAAAKGATVYRRSPAIPDFQRALQIVQNAAAQPGNINYDTFCAKKPHQGSFKLGCQIKEMRDVGLLVCLEYDVCPPLLTKELSALRTLNRTSNPHLKVVAFYEEIISGLKCGKRGSPDVNCSGFLETWILKNDGMGRSLRSSIYQGKVDYLLTWLKQYQSTESARLVTANDLENIVRFMDPGTGKYTRICDLQGFFIEAGGFIIADPDDIVTREPTSYPCSDKTIYPTTEQVLEALNYMVASLRR